jgi:type IV secretory pathway VirB10-like protein
MPAITEPHFDTDALDDSASVDHDPHASKVALDDPRLSVPRPKSRVLKMRPVIAAVAVLAGLGGYIVLASLGKRDKAVAVDREPPKVPDRPPAVPAFIEQAPSTPDPPPAPEVQPVMPAPPTAARPYELPDRPDPREQQALQQELARQAELARAEEGARTSGLFFESGGRATSAAPPAAAPMPLAPPAAGGSGPAIAPGQNPDAWDPNLQARKNAFLDSPRLHPDYLSTTLQSPFSPYEVKAGTHIPATLIYGINSDLPGPIVAQVREQVYDTVTGDYLLIPQGARLIASYDSMVAWGQERILMCWNRVIFPNGKSLNLECMPAGDLKGQAGLTDEVDNHWDRLLAAVGLSTVLSLGTQAAAGDPSGYQPNLAQRAAANAAGQINSAGQALVQRQINIQPTITVRPGFGVNVLVTKDMILEPYVEGP